MALVVAVVLSCGSIDEDELVCEEAVSRLEDCCPAFDIRRYSCEARSGCFSSNVPDLTVRASDCVRARSCGELRERAICEGLTRLSNEPYPAFARDAIEMEACR